MPTALVPLAQGCEEMEAVTIIDVLRRGGVEVVAASLDGGPVKGSRGTVLMADQALEAVKDRAFDLVALPGGQPGTRNLAADPRVASLLKGHAAAGAWVAAVCAAPSVLAAAGLLEGRRATSYPGALDQAAGVVKADGAVVVDGRIVTSRSAGTAMDFALALVALLMGDEKKTEVEKGLLRP